MSKNEDFLNEVMGLLYPIDGIRCKAMFGGYGIFHEDDMFALIKGTGLFFKVNDSNRPDYEIMSSSQYKPMPYFQVPADVFDKPDSLLEWAGISIKVAHSSSKKKPH